MDTGRLWKREDLKKVAIWGAGTDGKRCLDAVRMVDLAAFYAAVANEGDTGMEWMGMAAPLNEMPGMATEDETTELDADQGPAADKLFVRLMIAHHQGGIHMAEYAAAHAGTQTVRAFAYSVVAGQQSEINELQALAAKL